ncbi:hypothetical protein NPIL_49171 [Nephila pilipes]|uniref:Uncharacterized protein n=1 Tax=Nephila pilipes TaxID=299642 RepID=A0A8X6JTH7_NEPPI|nr:hypothetical protein NPIL_49171 [Nephila pilipes]
MLSDNTGSPTEVSHHILGRGTRAESTTDTSLICDPSRCRSPAVKEKVNHHKKQRQRTFNPVSPPPPEPRGNLKEN